MSGVLALRSVPADTALADTVAQTGARVVNAADTILIATKPPRLIDQVTEAMAVQMERDIVRDRLNELTAHTAAGISSHHPQQQPPSTLARPIPAPAR